MDEERASLRLFLRALRRLPAVPQLARDHLDARAPATRHRGSEPACASGCGSPARGEMRLEELLGAADVLCAASGGLAPAPSLVLKSRRRRLRAGRRRGYPCTRRQCETESSG